MQISIQDEIHWQITQSGIVEDPNGKSGDYQAGESNFLFLHLDKGTMAVIL